VCALSSCVPLKASVALAIAAAVADVAVIVCRASILAEIILAAEACLISCTSSEFSPWKLTVEVVSLLCHGLLTSCRPLRFLGTDVIQLLLLILLKNVLVILRVWFVTFSYFDKLHVLMFNVSLCCYI